METPSQTPKVSENPLDYLSMVIYVRRNVPICERLISLTSSHLDIHIQDVDTIKGSKPAWLTGVPTVITLPSRAVTTGSQAMATVEAHCAEVAAPVQCSTYGSCATINENAQPSSGRFAALYTPEDIPYFNSEEKYHDAPREKVHDVSLEELIRRRA